MLIPVFTPYIPAEALDYLTPEGVIQGENISDAILTPDGVVEF